MKQILKKIKHDLFKLFKYHQGQKAMANGSYSQKDYCSLKQITRNCTQTYCHFGIPII
jgi:hypothetical protein